MISRRLFFFYFSALNRAFIYLFPVLKGETIQVHNRQKIYLQITQKYITILPTKEDNARITE